MKFIPNLLCLAVLFFFTKENSYAQHFESISITGVYSGNETNNTLFKAKSSTISSLAYIRAQRIKGPQDGFFTQNKDNIRYTSTSTVSGIPGNLSRIRFSFLKADKKTFIPLSDLRFIINDIDGPDNEALATNCDANLRFLGTANPTNLMVINMPPTIIAIGAKEEEDGPTSRVMFEFKKVSVVELDNYGNKGYLKDFDLNDDLPIAKPIYVRCKPTAGRVYTQIDTDEKKREKEFIEENNQLKIFTKAIYFDTDKFIIRRDAINELKKVVRILDKYPELIIELHSHTDSKSPDDYNMELSINRSNSVVNWIVEKGIDPNRITGKGFGETQLVNKCSNGVKCSEEEHQLNRRTEFVIVNPEVLNIKR